MTRVALKGLSSAAAARSLTAIAIVLGVATVTAPTSSPTDHPAFDDIFSASFSATAP